MKAVEALKARFGIAPILRVLGVAESTYYGWLSQQRDPSPRHRLALVLLGWLCKKAGDSRYCTINRRLNEAR